MSAAVESILVLDGEVTVQRAAELKSVLLTALDDEPTVGVDLSAVTELDTAGLQLLLMLKHQAWLLGRTVRFTAPSGAVQEVLNLARLDLQLERVTEPDPLSLPPRDQKSGVR